MTRHIDFLGNVCNSHTTEDFKRGKFRKPRKRQKHLQYNGSIHFSNIPVKNKQFSEILRCSVLKSADIRATLGFLILFQHKIFNFFFACRVRGNH